MAGAPIDKSMVEVERELAIAYGFVSEWFRLQSVHPLVNSAVVRLLDAVLLSPGRLTRSQKKSLLHAVACAQGTAHCWAFDPQALPVDGKQSDALQDFALQLACCGLWFSAKDTDRLMRHGFDEHAILEAVVTTALAQMLCILAEAVESSNGVERSHPIACEVERPFPPNDWEHPAGPYLKCPLEASTEFAPFSFLRDQLGFIPRLFREQMSRSDLVAEQIHFLGQIVHAEEPLSRIPKEEILLAVSASNLNTYGVALQRQILGGLGVDLEQSDAIVNDLGSALIPAADKALLEEVSKLNGSRPRGEVCFQTKTLESHGFTNLQSLEAIAVAAFANFLNILQFGLGVPPDFPPARVFTPKDLYPSTREVRPTSDERHAPDPDAELVKEVRDGKVDVFEELVRRHSRRVFGTVAGILGNLDDARDSTQDVFLKAFENIASFEGRAKFSTWLISIAIHTATEMLRHRKRTELLGVVDDEEDFRPRQVQQWAEDPEQIFSDVQRNELVRDKILQLPEKYRVALMWRDINQLSIEEAAAALEIGVPAFKARVLRGRLMLRERLAPHFTRHRERDDA